MEKIAPHIQRQRYLIEGFYELSLNEEVIELFFEDLIKGLKFKKLGQGPLFLDEKQKDLEAFLPLENSSLTLKVWRKEKFLSVCIFSTQIFDEKKALEITQKYFEIKEILAKDF